MGSEARAVQTPQRIRVFPRLRISGQWNLYAGLAVVGMMLFLSLLAPWISPYDPVQNALSVALKAPSAAHWLGTDNFGRDIFTRVIYAARLDLQIGLIAAAVPMVIGVALGALAGYFGGWLDVIVMRIVDVTVSIPFLVLILSLMAILSQRVGSGLSSMYIAVFLAGWTAYARIIRAEVLVQKQQEYVLACKVLGYGHARIIFRHILRNAITPAIVFAMSDIVMCILLASSLSFLGLGVKPPTPEWGAMAAEGRNFMLQAWWITTMPGLAIGVTGLGFSLIGDGLADRIDQGD
ncbi:MAG: Peptide/nickel transport system permease protein [Firmicutes bacterium]|nr:Peptide/nickel transport system permease protein [Bacillota bacterium]